MRKSSPIPDILQKDGFLLHYYVGRLFKVGFVGQCCIVAVLVAIMMLAASKLDHSWILPGTDVGLLEHPALWGFPLLQVVIPLCVLQSVRKLMRARLRNGLIIELEGKPAPLLRPVRNFLRWRDKTSRLAAALIYLIGFSAIVWNTYQNQRPGIVVPYDFWDSKNFVWGFVITRIYKSYFFVWFLPYLGMIQVAVLVVILRFVRHTRIAGKLKLSPFHPDGVGGLGFVASVISTPVIITVVVGALTTGVVFFAHHGVAATPLMALSLLVGWVIVAYFVPIFFLRSHILKMKKEMLETLRGLQRDNYTQITKNHGHDLEMLGKGKEALDYFDKVCANIEAIPNYPHLRRLLRFSTLSMIPSAIQIAIKLYQNAGPLLGPLLKTH